MLRRLSIWLLLPLLASGLFLFAYPQPSDAARGGRIGGGSFRSAPSFSRGGAGNFRGGARGGGGFGGGGIGFPFLIPMFGFGGGGLFGFLILMTIAGVLVNALRGGGAGGGGGALPSANGRSYVTKPDGPVAVAQLQVGLLANARELQQDLRRLAETANTSNSAGLQKVLQETCLALMRQPELWVYANCEVGQVPFVSAESTFNRLSMTERSKLRSEVTSNVAGQRLQDSGVTAGNADATSDFIAITLLVASRSRLPVKTVNSAESLREGLRLIGAVSATDLLALEVIWQPEGEGEVLSTEELLTAYPQLQHL